MASRTVKSPTGDEIEIVDDDDWALTAGVELRSLAMWTRSKPYAIRELWEHGPVADNSGGATKVLRDRMLSHFPDCEEVQPTALTMLMKDPANSQAFERNISGKRTYRIELVALPETWYRKLTTDIGESMPTFTATPVNGTRLGPIEDEREAVAALVLPEEIEELPPIETSPVIEVEVASQVAMELLTAVVEIISAGNAADASPELRRLRNELVHSQGLLSERLSDNDRLRKQIRITGDELHAVKLERDGLRTRLRQTEANLNSALKGETAHAVTTEVMKRVDRIMRETPKPHKRGEE